MAAQLVPIRLGVTAGDFYTLWAPRWRDAGDEWEGFLGRDEDLYGFESVADLTAFVRSGADNDLDDHPAWERLRQANAHKLQPGEDRQADLIGAAELLAGKPTEASVEALANTLAVVSSIGSVCELPTVTRFFNGNPTLGLVVGGIDQFTGRAGRKRWSAIGEIFSRSWDGVVAAIDEIITTPEVDHRVAAEADAELEQPYDDVDEEFGEDIGESIGETFGGNSGEDFGDSEGSNAVGIVPRGGTVILGGDAKFWEQVGIDPIRVVTSSSTLYTLRCYLDNKPIFLGRNGRISVFGSERALARYLADEHDHDLSDLSTYDDIRTAATDGSLRVDVTDDNVYVLNGLVDDIADGPEALDRDQLALAVEFIRDVGDYSEDDTIDRLLAPDTALGQFVSYTVDPDAHPRPGGSSAAAAQWEELESFTESRLRRE
jgi:hypothetical protein